MYHLEPSSRKKVGTVILLTRYLEKENAVNKMMIFLRDISIFTAFLPFLLMLAPQNVDPIIMRPLATFSCFIHIVFENQLSKNVSLVQLKFICKVA